MMWFSGAINNITGIFAATSSDGAHWSVRNLPALKPGVNGTWDSGVIYSPDVVWNGTIYLMYFVGNNGSVASRSIGVAFSADNINWREWPQNPVVRGGPNYYDGAYVRFPSVLFDGRVYKMWYTGHSPVNSSTVPNFFLAIDYATSPDGVHWTKYPGNPVLGGSAYWGSNNSVFFEHPSVVKINDTYLMVGDDGFQISFATSKDGMNWNASRNSLLLPASQPSWDNYSATFPSIVLTGTEILLWFTGSSQVVTPKYSVDQSNGIGLASCHFLFVSTTNTVTTTFTATTTNLITQTTTSTTTAMQTQTVTTTRTTSLTETLVGVPSMLQYIAATGGVVLGASALALAVIMMTRRRLS